MLPPLLFIPALSTWKPHGVVCGGASHLGKTTTTADYPKTQLLTLFLHTHTNVYIFFSLFLLFLLLLRHSSWFLSAYAACND